MTINTHFKSLLGIISAVVITAGVNLDCKTVEAGIWCNDDSCCTSDPCCDTDSCCDVSKCFSHKGCNLFKGLCSKKSCLSDSCSDPCVDECCPGDECGLGCGGGCSWCDLGDPVKVFSGADPLDIGMWSQVGYSDGTDGLFQDNPHRVNLHQQWLYVAKAADGSEGLDWGFRFDLMYGTDADDTQAFGNNPGNWDFQNGFDRGGGYGWAIPQLYGEIAMGDLSIIGGHFYTVLGYEVVTAPDNFFFSHAFTMFNSEPFTHTGAIATYAVSDDLTVRGGWTAGWDTGFDQRFGGNNFIGGFTYNVTDDVSFTYNTTAGNFGNIGHGYAHSIVATMAPTDNIEVVLQSDLVEIDDFETIGFMSYFFYTFNDCVKAGSRWEWWKADGNSLTAVTYGWNFRPHANVVIRPEFKYIESEHPDAVIGFPVNTGIFSVDTVVTY